MKGAIVLLEKDNILVRTSYSEPGIVKWFGEEKRLVELISEGFVVKDNLLLKAIQLVGSLHDKFVWKSKMKNEDFLDLKKLLEDY